METKNLELIYHKEKDILTLIIFPLRDSRASGNEYDFLVLYDKDNPAEIVGFEILDFSLLVPHLYEADVVPEVDMVFAVANSPLTNATLLEVLEWAYRRYVVAHVPAWHGREAELTTLALL